MEILGIPTFSQPGMGGSKLSPIPFLAYVMIYSYFLYGLNIRSEWACNEPPIRGDYYDIDIHYGNVVLPSSSQRSIFGTRYYIKQDAVVLQWDGIGNFRVERGCDITAMPADDVDGEILHRTLQGSVLAAALYQRGSFLLHASAVEVEGQAIVFAGESGWGKSTLAAALHARGHQIITDDIVVCQSVGAGFQVMPGLSECRLWPDSLQTLGKEAAGLPYAYPGQEKRIAPLADQQTCHPVRMRNLYFLERGECAALLPIAPAQAMLELLRLSYGTPTLVQIDPATHFRHATRLTQTVPMKRLQRSNDFAQLPALVEMVEADIAAG